MSEAISPYALLRASKPKPAPTIVTAYDLYSAAQSAPPVSSVQSPANQSTPIEDGRSAAGEVPRSVSALPASAIPAQRTHYISDIKTRHNAAMRRARLNTHPLT